MTPLAAILVEKIETEGPISIAEYMALALSHPEHGYYQKQQPFGAQGDFTTSPEISQVFGEMIGVWCVERWYRMGQGPIALVELGPGRGTLMQDLLRATRGVAEFHDALTIHMVETSARLAHMQYLALRDLHPRIEWLDHIGQVPEKRTLLVANEFFDALPIRQHVETKEGLCERKVSWNAALQLFEFVLGPPGLQLAKSGTVIADGTVMESSPASRDMMRTLARQLKTHGGAALVVDYGYLGDSHTDTLQAVKRHMYHPVLKDPGEADITAHVDFRTLMDIARAEGLGVEPLQSQAQFLVGMGVEARLEALLKRATPEQKSGLVAGVERLIAPQMMGELFKVMIVGA
jgi:NADH dehydrogenase [ubiquinone] 1 alpha subcomplex assembly factor 7